MPWKRGTLAAAAVVALLHTALTMAMIAYGFGLTMDRFDTATEPSALEARVSGLVDILLFPLGHIALAFPAWFPGYVGFLLLVANGVLWAVTLVAGWRALRRRR